MEFLKNFALTVKGIVLTPKIFFDQIEWDSGWKEPLTFLSICAAVFALANATAFTSTLCGLAAVQPIIANEINTMGVHTFFLTSFGVSFIFTLIGSLAISFASTIAMHFLGGTGNFQRTYTALSCAWVVLLVQWIPFIGFLFSLYFFYLAAHGMAKAHNVPVWKGAVAPLIGTTAITICLGILAFCIVFSGFLSSPYTRSLNRYQSEYSERERFMAPYLKKADDEAEQ
ncbi:MAG: YIP1 family protein [Candidatus Obscuribacterales bacterium]|nr:YIP1 family protein [Candidatus Obscuribacterales bacterium]